MATAKQGNPEGTQQAPTVRWDDTQMTTTYANVVNAASTREEVAIFFGTNQTWNLSKDKEVIVQLTNRIILNPFAANRLHQLLGGILREYESRYGSFDGSKKES